MIQLVQQTFALVIANGQKLALRGEVHTPHIM